jgi:hypothetical protein
MQPRIAKVNVAIKKLQYKDDIEPKIIWYLGFNLEQKWRFCQHIVLNVILQSNFNNYSLNF